MIAATFLLVLLTIGQCHAYLPSRTLHRSSTLHSHHKQPKLRMSTSVAPSDKRVVIVGATGYIGKFVVKEAVRRGYNTVAVVRPESTPNMEYLKGATIVTGDVTDTASLSSAFSAKTDVVISCLASRSGVKEDSYLIDYQATKKLP